MKKNKIIIICSTLLMSFLLIFTIVSLTFNSNNVIDSEFEKGTGYYKSSQKEIVSAEAQTSTYKFMSNLYEISNNVPVETSRASSVTTNDKIAIISAQDLYAFSYLANPSTNNSGYAKFLTFKYELLTNIDYDSYFNSTGGSKYFMPIGWNKNLAGFSGSFNGNGFEIKGLRLQTITQEITENDPYNNFQYFAMFSHNTGTLTNFGLVETRIAISQTINEMSENGGVAPLVGLNEGSVTYCYVKDLREVQQNASLNEVGITAMGGYYVSGFAVTNTGTMTDCYCAYSMVSNYTVTDMNYFVEMLVNNNNNNGTVDRLYFYNASITSYEAKGEDVSDGAKISYTSIIGLSYDWTTHYGIYSNTLASLTTAVKASDNSWIDSSHYGDALSSYVSIETPVRRGLNLKENTTDTLLINNLSDYLFMYLLFNSNVNMASGKVKYEITADINLTGIPTELYSYDGNISSTIYGANIGDSSTATLVDGNKSPYPTIYNATIYNKQIIEGIEAYGIYPYLNGKIENLNFANTEGITFTETATSNIKAIGLVSGYVDGGTINNVNTFANISFNENIGKYFVGGVVGILAGKGTISNVTTSGSSKALTNVSVAETSINNPTDFIIGKAIGGIVGHISSTYGTIENCYNTYNITAGLGNTANASPYAIGGIVGAAYTYNASNLENTGSINVTSSTYTAPLYVAGIIGRHLGVQSQIKYLNNQGDINVDRSNNTVSTYVSGIDNIDIQTASGQTISNSEPSKQKVSGNFVFYASNLTNRANVIVNTNSSTKLEYTKGINLNSNGYISEISGLYNLAYRTTLTSNNTKTTTKLDDISIDPSIFNKFAPVVNKIGTSGSLSLTTVYNLQDMAFNTSVANTTAETLKYTGCILGQNINYNDVRNEGNMNFTIDEQLGNSNNNRNLYISGLIEEISAANTADILFNDGNINVNYSADIYGDVNVAGICFKNANTSLNANINKYNPNSTLFDSEAIGAMNNAMNNGVISITNDAYESGVTYTQSKISSANGQQDIGYRWATTFSGGTINGNINVAGITIFNYSVITNTFNLTDIFVANFAETANKLFNVAGITDVNIGQYAYISNSANNGEIKGINLSSANKATLAIAGIVARNDITDILGNYEADNGHSKQVIAFTINYGSIYSYNFNENIVGSNAEPNAISAGIVGMGLLNVTNVLNYGNIYGSETLAGIFGVVYFARFASEVTNSSKVMLANTINYGNTMILYRGYNYHENANNSAVTKGHYDHNIIRYSMFKGMDLTSSTFTIAETSYNRINYANYVVDREVSYKSINGSIFSIINFNNSNNAQNVTIRYLINFEENAPIVGFEPATPSNVSVDRSTIYSAYSHLDTRNNGSGQLVRDTYMAYINEENNNFVVYSPLNDATGETVKAVTTNSTSDVLDASTVHVGDYEYNGIFSKEFAFFKAINKSYTESELRTNPTDAFLSDFFQFVEYSYINEVLIEKIGWKDLAYVSAANTFARTIEKQEMLLNALTANNKTYPLYTTDALNNNNSWIKYATEDTLNRVISDMIKNNEVDDLKEMLGYIFSGASSSLINKELRESIFNSIINDLSSEVLTSILTYTNGYSKALADAILDSDSEVYEFVNSYLTTLTAEEKKNLLQSYVNVLNGNTTAYFNYSNNLQNRYNILNSMFDGIDDSFFYQTLCDILDISSSASIDSKLKMLQGYETLSNNDKFKLYLAIIENNDYSKIDTYLSSMESEIDFYNRLKETGYIVTSQNDINNSIASSTTTNTDESIINERVELWNRLRKNQTFISYLKSRMTNPKYYFKATEHNNTYQSTTAPSESGLYSGDLSYFYTTSVTPSTYFFGPYKSADANGTNVVNFTSRTLTYSTSFDYESISGSTWHSVFVADSLAYVDTYKFYDFNTSYFMNYTNETTGFENEIGTNAIKGVLPAALFMYEYGYTGANNQFASAAILKSNYYQKGRTDFDGNTGAFITDFGGTTFKTTDAYLTYNGNTIPLSNATVSYHVGVGDDDDVRNRTVGKFQIVDANGNQYTINCEVGGNFIVHDDEIVAGSSRAQNLTYLNNDYYTLSTTDHTITYKNSGDRTWGDLLYRYGRNYYFSEVDETYHETKHTGIYQYASGRSSYDLGANSGYSNRYAFVNWLTHKQSESNPIYTTLYMDYTVDQLLELDGYYTKFNDGTTLCTDERNIINAIFNYYLCSDSENFAKAIRKSLLDLIEYNTYIKNNVIAKTWENSYEYNSAELVKANSTYGYAEDGTRLYNTDNYINSNGEISGNFKFWRWYDVNNDGNGWKPADYTYTVNISNINYNNNGNIITNDLVVNITGYRDLQGSDYNEHDGASNDITITEKSYVSARQELTIKFTSNTQFNGTQRYDKVTLVFSVLTIGSGANKKVATVVFKDKTVMADTGGGADTDITNQWQGQTPTNGIHFENSANSFNVFISYRRNYNYNGWKNSWFYYGLTVNNFSFDEDGKITDFDYTIDGGKRYTPYDNTNGYVEGTYNLNNTNFPTSYRKKYINGNLITINFRCNVANTYYDDVFVSFKIISNSNGTINVATYVNDPYTITNNVIKETINESDSTIATVSVSNYQFGNTTFNNDVYYYLDETKTDSNRTLSLEFTLKNNVNIDYIDQFMYANINSSTTINSSVPFAYLYYSNSNSQTVKAYLESLASISSTDYKQLVIMNAAKNESKYYELLDNLLNANVPTTNVELTEFTSLTTSVDGKAATIYQEPTTLNYVDYYYGFTFDTATEFSIDVPNAELPGTISIVSKNTNNSAQYKYVINYSDTSLGQNVTTGLTPVNVTTTQSNDILVSKYVQANHYIVDNTVTESNYTHFYILDNGNYVIPSSWDENATYYKDIIANNYADYYILSNTTYAHPTGAYDRSLTYYFDATSSDCEVTITISSISNVAFYNISQDNAIEYQEITDTYTGVYYFTDTVSSNLDRFSNPGNNPETEQKTNDKIYYFNGLMGTYKIRNSSEINVLFDDALEEENSEELSKLNQFVSEHYSNYVSYSTNGFTVNSANIEVVGKVSSAGNAGRYYSIYCNNSATRAASLAYNNDSIIFTTKKDGNGFHLNGAGGKNDQSAGLYIGPGTDSFNENSIRGEIIVGKAGQNAAISLLHDYTTITTSVHDDSTKTNTWNSTSGGATTTDNHVIKYFDNLGMLSSDQGSDISLSLVTNNPKDSLVGHKTNPGSYYIPGWENHDSNTSVEDYFSNSITEKVNGNNDWYLHAIEYDSTKNNAGRFGNANWGNQIPGIQNVMYKIQYSLTVKIIVEVPVDSDVIQFYSSEQQSKYIGAKFHGVNNAISHSTDYVNALTNLLPLCSNEYAYGAATDSELSEFDTIKSSLYEKSIVNGNTVYTLTLDETRNLAKTYYKVNATYVKTLKNIILQWLNDHPNGDYTLNNFYKLLVCSSNDAFVLLLNKIYDYRNSNPTAIKDIYSEILSILLEEDNGYLYAYDFIKKYNLLGLTNSNIIITAAYLASDYERLYQQSTLTNNIVLLADSQLKALLVASGVEYENVSIQYINSNGTFDNDKFDALLKYIGDTSNNDVYGIFALASSRGIKNGTFIPDNLVLATLNANYEEVTFNTDKVVNYLTTGNSYYTLSGTTYTKSNSYNESTTYYVIDAKVATNVDGDNVTNYYTYDNGVYTKASSYNAETTYYDLVINEADIISTFGSYELNPNVSYWRGGSIANPNLTTDTDSVNYHVLVEMKQLKKSISTTLFELDLVYDGSTNLYSSESQIDLDNKTVTYYVPKGYVDALNANDKTSINLVEAPIIANMATYVTNVNNNPLVINLTNKSFNENDYTLTVENALTITAEETSIVAQYDVIFKGIDISFDMAYETDKTNHEEIVTEGNVVANSATIAYTGGVVLINVTSPAVGEEKDKLPKNFDLSQFIYLIKSDETGDKLTKDAFIITAKNGNAIVKDDGSAVIQLEILNSLPAGTYHLHINIYGTDSHNNSGYITLIKNASSECDIELFNYEGTDRHSEFTLNDDVYEYTTYVDYGIAYNYNELLNYTYLEELKYSDNATLNVTVEKDTPSANGQMTYTVTYTVTAENDSDSKVYKHYLKEKNSFKTYLNNEEQNTAFSFTTIYKDGSSIGTYNFDNNSNLDIIDQNGHVVAVVNPTIDNGLITTATATNAAGNVNYTVTVNTSTHLDLEIKQGNTLIAKLNNIVINDGIIVGADAYSGENSDEAVMVSKDTDNNLYVSFARGFEPTFRIKFVLSNFYSEYDNHGNNDITFEAIDDNTYGANDIHATLDGATAGFFATVSNDMDAGTYEFHYKYSHTGAWDDSPYTREFTFPKLVITKTYSKDAKLQYITFLESYKVIGNTATAILPGKDGVMIPSVQSESDSSRNANDVLYNRIFSQEFVSPVTVDENGKINYTISDGPYGDSTSYLDYYVVGTVSGADLQEYAPLFVVEDNAMIFKSTTLYKINHYGAENNQTETDKSILEHHSNENDDINFIYVPFYEEVDDLAHQRVMMVSIDESGYWTGIYPLTTTSASNRLLDISSLKLDTIHAKAYDTGFVIDNKTYKVSQYAGSTSIVNNTSIFMDFIGNPLENHFHYISYMVMSESYLKNTPASGVNNGSSKYFHVALIDTSNTVYFDVSLYAPNTDFDYDNLYITIAENLYINSTKYNKSISAYAEQAYVVNDNQAQTNGMKKYNLVQNLQVLPSGYFYFYIDLPEGYKATYVVTNGKTNQINSSTSIYAYENEGAYVAPNSIVTQTIKVAIIIEPAETLDASVWAVKTSDTFTRQIVQVQALRTVSDEHPDY